ncbi:MAG: methenyltetrahydromethanopterin cyclohydrolase [Planctomycetota bacterium]
MKSESKPTEANHSSQMVWQNAATCFESWLGQLESTRCEPRAVGQAVLLDAGVESAGGFEAGIWLARLCMSDLASIETMVCSPANYASSVGISVRTDFPVLGCLASQYAGWPISVDSFFAMGSGSMRVARGREPMLEHLGLVATPHQGWLTGVLESDVMPDEKVVQEIASQCGVKPEQMRLAIAPTSSLAGCIQVVARVVETAMHKLHELGFDVETVRSASGNAPICPPAKPGDMVGGIGRTNDAILYGGTVDLFVECDDDVINEVVDRVPSSASDDHGRPFAQTFKSYDYDFYKVDPMLFSPAIVNMHSLKTGRSYSAGTILPELLRESFSS